MNRKERRAAASGHKAKRELSASNIAELSAAAERAYANGKLEDAELAATRILATLPAHRQSILVLGAVYQATGRHRMAIKQFQRAIEQQARDALPHYNLGCSYQILNEPGKAEAHFKRSIELGIDIEELVAQHPSVVAAIGVILTEDRSSARREVIGKSDIAALSDDIFLNCALRLVAVRGVELEQVLTELRRRLLEVITEGAASIPEATARLTAALAAQCFLTEYVYAVGETELRRTAALREEIAQELAAGVRPSPIALAAIAAYLPLHEMPDAARLTGFDWPDWIMKLLQQQILEPSQDRRERQDIPRLTSIDDATSRDVRQQYEENPYPRWTLDRLAGMGDEDKKREARLHSNGALPGEILIAGCGSGQHACEIAQYFPDARILAVDLSLTSLAYAKRRAREQALGNLEFAQADIFKLDALAKTFDRIECVGVLHHLADPFAGWRVLLGLLRRSGMMRIGLYSALARRTVLEARALAAEYGADAAGIRKFRQSIIRDAKRKHWEMLLNNTDFYSVSGCRDLIFNVMEHRLTISQIAEFIAAEGLAFLGFELPEKVMREFRERHGTENVLDLGKWHEFEQSNPDTFRNMYIFSVAK